MSNQRSAKTIYDKISVVFGLGFMPKAPGTWGSLPGIPLGMLVYTLCSSWTGSSSHPAILSGSSLLMAAAILTLLSWAASYCIAKTESAWQIHDDKAIVIDEVLGQMLAIAWFPPSFSLGIWAFILFRFFDIVKPGPVGWVDKNVHIPFGTLLDDLIAGTFAAAIIYSYYYFY